MDYKALCKGCGEVLNGNLSQGTAYFYCDKCDRTYCADTEIIH